MKLQALALGLAALTVVAAASPAAAADKETRQMMADIRILQEQEQQIQTALATLTEQLKAMDTRLGARIDDQTETTRKGFADEKTVTSNISNDVRTLRERLDDNTTSVGKVTVEVQALRQLITSRTVAPPADTGAPEPADSSSGSAAVTPSAVGASPSALFDQAFGDYTSGQYDLAIEGFKAFINTFPTAPQAADAQVNICSSYTNLKKYREAVDACDTAIRNYGKSPVAPMAYYRKGMAHAQLGELDQAKAAFDYVDKTWPDTQAATLAEQGLNALSPKRP
jgi:tol-pal system protein YbgF